MMKSLKLFGSFILLTLLLSCHDDCETANNSNLKGTWNLVNATGDIINEDFPAGQITWKFNTNAQTVKITNNSTTGTATGLPTGDYAYEVNPNTQSGEEQILVNGSNFGILSFSGTVMYMDLSPVDGIKYKFSR